MSDTISALDTATTDELIAALNARHKTTLGLACSQLTEPGQVIRVTTALTQELCSRLATALCGEMRAYTLAHPAIPAPNPLRETPPEPPGAPTTFWIPPFGPV